MSIGGFNGSDPSPTLEELQALVADDQIHRFLGGGGFGPQNGGSSASSEIAAWVETTFDPTTIGGTTVFNLSASAA